jgi:integrase
VITSTSPSSSRRISFASSGQAGVVGFRFHDYRHDLGTKLLRETGNLKLVQRALNHADIKSTLRYAHVLDSEVADALERVAKSRSKSRSRLREVS